MFDYGHLELNGATWDAGVFCGKARVSFGPENWNHGLSDSARRQGRHGDQRSSAAQTRARIQVQSFLSSDVLECLQCRDGVNGGHA